MSGAKVGEEWFSVGYDNGYITMRYRNVSDSPGTLSNAAQPFPRRSPFQHQYVFVMCPRQPRICLEEIKRLIENEYNLAATENYSGKNIYRNGQKVNSLREIML